MMQNFVMLYILFLLSSFWQREKEIAIERCVEPAKVKHEIRLRVFFVLLLPVSVENGVENLCVCVTYDDISMLNAILTRRFFWCCCAFYKSTLMRSTLLLFGIMSPQKWQQHQQAAKRSWKRKKNRQ